jgi:hypothetical protein|tara:strand:+ start:10538 stop:12190 length:1653 start_codon:yes stop_codon:yes gene_type:complete
VELSPNEIYLGNPRLKKAGVKLDYTEEQIQELVRCSKDIEYFCRTYMKIVNIDEGVVPLDLYDFQLDIMKSVVHNRFSICKMPRQSGKTTTMVAVILWFILFNESFNCAILANKASTAREILSRLQMAYEWLPHWLQQGLVEWNKGSLELENGSKVLASSTSSSAIRGGSFSLVYLDEFAFVDAQLQEEFFASVYPTISSGRTSRVMITSTPKGMNLFYKLWVDAEEGRNEYVPIQVHWSAVPGRDEAWREQTIKNTSEEQFRQEFECDFIGSSNTLINPSKLASLVFHDPIAQNENVKIWKEVVKGHVYAISVDTSRGIGNDYSAFTVCDCTAVPYEVVCTYRSNIISPMLYPNIIYDIARKYNDAIVLVEINDIGQQVADILHHELEYEGILTAEWKGRSGQLLTAGFGGKSQQLGVRTTKQLKRVGCASLKTIIENDRLVINDFEILKELTAFVVRGQSYAAEEGYNDDLVMSLVLFAWLTGQEYFKEMTDIDIRKNLLAANEKALEEDMLPFGFFQDGFTDPDDDMQKYSSDSLIVDTPYEIEGSW